MRPSQVGSSSRASWFLTKSASTLAPGRRPALRRAPRDGAPIFNRLLSPEHLAAEYLGAAFKLSLIADTKPAASRRSGVSLVAIWIANKSKIKNSIGLLASSPTALTKLCLKATGSARVVRSPATCVVGLRRSFVSLRRRLEALGRRYSQVTRAGFMLLMYQNEKTSVRISELDGGCGLGGEHRVSRSGREYDTHRCDRIQL
jgi:hypothetical protein